MPSGWRDHSAGRRLISIARDAHADGGLDDSMRDELDVLVGRMYGLGPAGLETLRHFDLWLSGREE